MDNLLLRRRMMGKPYTTQVAYLENASLQEFIEIPLSLGVGDWVKIMYTIEPIGKTSLSGMFSARPSYTQLSSATSSAIPSTTVTYATWCGNSATNGGISVPYDNVLTIGLSVDEVFYQDGTTFQLSRPLTNQITSILFFKSLQYSAVHQLRLHALQIYVGNASNKVYDLIPVRVGTVGYMYDKISGSLFGNLGSGEFVVGPDVQ